MKWDSSHTDRCVSVWTLWTLKSDFKVSSSSASVKKIHIHKYKILSVCISSSSLPSPVGQDCYTRLWSLKDGHLLRTIPSPHPAANDLIPSVVFSSKLGGCRGLPGLLMAVKHDLYYFPYNTDYQDGGEQPASAY